MKKKRTQFIFLRYFLEYHFSRGDISEKHFLEMLKIINEEDERLVLESEE